MLKFGSVCSGIEAASVAWGSLGWQAQFFSEIDKFPSAVLAHHYPEVPNLGDMTRFKDWPDATIDVLCGGTPCQSFSNAGLRAGLDDPRGQLMLTFGAIAARYRPKWLVWENVPGVLSSNGGRDFAGFLGLITGQQIAPPKEGWQSAGVVPGIPDAYGCAWRVLDAQFVRVDGYGRAVPQRRNRVFVVGCLGDWRSAAAVLLERESLRGDSAPRRSAGAGSAARALCSTNGGVDREDRHTLVIAFGGNPKPGDPCRPLAAGAHAPAIAGTMASNGDAHSGFKGADGVIPMRAAVRRLAPTECERLMGFPDGYTQVPFRGKPAADGPRYKALGNSWAVNCARWIGWRITQVEAIHAERAC